MINMDDVALKANVSKTTVSRVLNGNAKVSDQTRDKVLAACNSLNYKLNASIQDLAKKSRSGYSSNIAFVLTGRELSDPAYAPLLDPMAEEVNARNLHLMLVKLNPEVKSIFDLPPVLRDNRVDGIFLTGVLSRQITRIFEELNIPTLILGEYHSETAGSLPQISFDLSRIFEKAIDQAFAQGVKRLAIATEIHDFYLGEVFLEYYRKGLARNGQPFDESLIYWQRGCDNNIYLLLKPIFMQQELPFDAILTPEFHAASAIVNLCAARYAFDKTPALTLIGNPLVPTEVLSQNILLEKKSDQMIGYAFDLIKKLQSKCSVPYKTII